MDMSSADEWKRLQADIEIARQVIIALRWLMEDTAPQSSMDASGEVLDRLGEYSPTRAGA